MNVAFSHYHGLKRFSHHAKNKKLTKYSDIEKMQQACNYVCIEAFDIGGRLYFC